MSPSQTSRPGDPLASLRIDRSRKPRSGWFGKSVGAGLLVLCLAAGGWAWLVYGDELRLTQVKVASVEARAAGAADSVLSAQGYLKS